MLNHLAALDGKDVRAFSAGSAPSGRVNPLALSALADVGVETSRFRSKSWDEFSAPGAPRMRIVITVCDSAAAEACPYWPGSPLKVHWGYPDPSNAPEAERAAAFARTRDAIAARMRALLQLPLDTLSDDELVPLLRALSSV